MPPPPPPQVLGDRSIKYRYLNPNTLLVVTGSPPAAGRAHQSSGEADESSGAALTAVLLDTVTGRVIHRQEHAAARGPVQALFTENLVVYQYWDSAQARWGFRTWWCTTTGTRHRPGGVLGEPGGYQYWDSAQARWVGGATDGAGRGGRGKGKGGGSHWRGSWGKGGRGDASGKA